MERRNCPCGDGSLFLSEAYFKIRFGPHHDKGGLCAENKVAERAYLFELLLFWRYKLGDSAYCSFMSQVGEEVHQIARFHTPRTLKVMNPSRRLGFSHRKYKFLGGFKGGCLFRNIRVYMFGVSAEVWELEGAILAKSGIIARLREIQYAILLFRGKFSAFRGNKTL